MSPIWETFANASVNGFRAKIKGATYWLARVQYASTPSGQGNPGGSAANSTHAYYSFQNSLGNFVHRFKQDATFMETRNIGSGNLGWINSTETLLTTSAGATSLYISSPTNYFATGSARTLGAQSNSTLIDSSNFLYSTDYGAANPNFYKLDSAGNTQWLRTMPISANQGVPDGLGNIFGVTSGANVVAHKLDTNGTYQWGRQVTNYTTTNGQIWSGDGSGGCMVGANLPSGTTTAVAQVTSSGTAGFGVSISNAVAVNTAAMTVKAGFTYWLVGANSGQDAYLIKLNSSGGVVWQRSFSGGGFFVRTTGYNVMSMAVDNDAVYISGVMSTNFAAYQHAYCFKYPIDGSITGSWNLGYSSNVVIAASSLSISNFTPTVSTSNSSASAAGTNNAGTYTTSAASTTQTIVKVP